MILLDTNTVSYLLKSEKAVIDKLATFSPSQVFISSLTEAELRFGVEKHANARLKNLIEVFLHKVQIIDFDSESAMCYAKLKNAMRLKGLSLAEIDLLIATHAYQKKFTLITSDQAFHKIPFLMCEDWRNA